MDEVGSVVSRTDYECADHVAAATLATILLPQRAQAEIWLGDRLIGSIAAAVEHEAR